MSRIATRMRNGIKRTFEKATNRRDKIRLRRAADRIEVKIKDKIDDMHKKLVKFLCERYDTVIIPNFRVQGMARKNRNGRKRKISKSTTRQMYRWSHYKFREELKAKGEITKTKIYVGTEEWTSKTCGNCMRIKHNLGGEKEFECEECGYKGDRDMNAARNIMMNNWEEAELSRQKVKLRIIGSN